MASADGSAVRVKPVTYRPATGQASEYRAPGAAQEPATVVRKHGPYTGVAGWFAVSENGPVVHQPPQPGTLKGTLLRIRNAGITLHIENLYGENNHHIAETCYKGLARALRAATEPDARQAGRVPSTKGTLAS